MLLSLHQTRTVMKKLEVALTGFLSVLGMAGNPFAKEVSRIRSQSIEQALNGDFQKIAQDYRKVYDRERKKLAPAKED